MWFTQISLRNPVFATMVMVAFVVLGLFSFQRLKVDQFPNIDFPVVVITTEYPGASPEIVESEVTKKVEESVNAIAGVNTLTSRSYEGQSVVIIEFQLHIDGRKAAEDVREKIAILRPTFRTDVKEPRVLRFDPAARSIWSVAVLPEAVNGKAPSAVELTTWAEQTLKKRMENVRGVGSVTLVGGTRRAVNIDLDPAAMEALGITAEQITTAVRNENQDLPVGTLKTAERDRVVQVLSRLQNPQDFEDIIVARRGGSAVRLAQVARVSDGTEEVESLALYNGQRTLLLQVQKAQDENTIAVTDGLKATITSLQAELPPGVRLEPIADGSRPIRVSVDNVRRTLIEGALLTVLIVFLFLNSWRSTVITGLTLPISVIGTFFFMNLFGFTINMITLMALTLSVGLLIDDAIVVRENIVRHVQMGKRPFDAAMDGTQEIGLAVLATTLSIVAVFLPIGFMGGIIGKFFHEFGITMVAAVLISMFVSFTLDPMLSSIWHDPEIEKHGQHAAPVTLYDKTIGRVTGWFDRVQDDLTELYQGTLRWSLKHKLATLGLALVVFVSSLFMVPLLGTEFVPKADFSETSLSFHTPVGSSLEATEAKTRQVEAILREFPEVKYTLSTINTGNAQGTMYASVYVRLVDRKDRSINADAMAAKLRERLRTVPGINVTHAGLLDPVGGNKQIEFSLQGDDLAELERLTAQVMERVRPIVGLVDLDASVKPDKPTVDVVMRREIASDAGLNGAAVASSLRTLVAGQTVGNWRAADGESYDVNVRLAPEQRARTSDLEQLPFVVGTAADGSARVVRLGQVAQVVESTGPNQINRRNLNREVAINANVFGRSAGDVSADIRQVLDTIAMPPGYRYEFGGSTKNMQESFGYAVSALALAIIFIYMILASQFQSFLQPLALMTALPLTLIGVVLTLLMFGSTMSMFSVIGIVLLMGLVTKNAILLVDFAIRARRGLDGAAPLDRESALLLAARVRLRPILMTTLAMVFGMVPLAFALTEGSEQRAPMGQAVIGGVTTSSLLTLVVVPVVYCYMDDFARWLRRLFGAGHTDDSTPVRATAGGAQ
ncbi:MAG: efflux RND transporter permease subunit [Gammaproteobacteria bacterium]|jgi:HAE1 family hydrophobic/amphiphilic exporter-1|uniref:efflux RND transporter permease subunit n=1 Tax=Hydrogenophaga sp. TaxID=1904254 RepID=UPI000CC4C362|nr:efflux RND transporter permease subunit [Hydrogenophaga sp.]MBU4182972.1 efflux RND transporter permease subunit [Gammaproteobacteria bacterium]PKO78434.1 MAG: nodulation protein NolG [Betaproteobacteria bacterium HGW-Betaproteobacteria-15]MBU4280074.1 efflux RND transporter permease subunit [Gammaproteobacteria bacterium]MBU4321717.1 efflux RND transporter permease subunit [Gammaproteobacteria bacterium]MCG2657752.1 efflux RND transporter permease subunit [Hydrogenophaga sp.]